MVEDEGYRHLCSDLLVSKSHIREAYHRMGSRSEEEGLEQP